MDKPVSLSRRSVAWRSGLSAALFLGLGVPVIMIAIVSMSNLVPAAHRLQAAAPAILVVLLLASFGLTGWLWGRSLARMTVVPDARRVARASALAFGPLTLVTMYGLGQAEVRFVEQRIAGDVPIHVVFAILFTVAAFVVTFGMALAADWAANGPNSGIQTPLWAGLAAALAFLMADIAQDMLGRRVGAPGAERTATMLTVAFIGNIIAAYAGGAVMGWRLKAGKPATVAAQPRPQEVTA
jgi:hypothetical protein